jgi:hypothetical protein
MCWGLLPVAVLAGKEDYFGIKVVDEQTGRGVPMVELETVNNIVYVTDSNGLVAFHEPGLMDRDVFFFVRSHGYEFPKDGFGNAGKTLRTTPGTIAEIKIKRLNIAERLYRITGQGIYRDSVLLGVKTPLREPLLNGQVVGRDSVQAVPYRGKIYWFWGDTSRPAYPLGHFSTAGATSELSDDPDTGVNLTYFTDANGFSRGMAQFHEEGLVWTDGVLTVPDENGRERLVAHYSRVKSLDERLEHGLMIFNDQTQQFEKLVRFDVKKFAHWEAGQALRVRENGADYFYFCTPLATTRVKATLADLRNLAHYERVHTDAKLTAADTGKPVKMHAGSISWNAYRKKWILVGEEVYGSTSFIGEIWYAEADKITGPWRQAKKIVTHNRYSFYNPAQHPFYDMDGGRFIYFEGTYSQTFSGNPVMTPRYDYNQIMYRLDLADPRLHLSAK